MSFVSNTIRNPLAPPIGTTTLPPDMGTGQAGGAPKGVRTAETPASASAARLPGPEQAKATAALSQASPDTGIFGRIKAGLSAFKEAMANLFTRSATHSSETAFADRILTTGKTGATTPTTPAQTTQPTDAAQPSTGETVKSLMDKLGVLMSRAGESSISSVDANELKGVLAGTDIGRRNLKKLDGIARQTADAFARLDRIDPADIGAAYRAGLSDESLAALKNDPAKQSVYKAAVVLKDALKTQANLSESLRIVLRGVKMDDDQYGAIMEMRLTCDRRISEINSLAEELSKLDAAGAQKAAGGRTTLQMLGAKTLEMHGNTDIFEAMKGPAGNPSAADRLSEMLESFKGRETVLTKQEFAELTRTVNEFNFDLLKLEHAGGVAPNGAKMDKAVLASARGVLGELLSKLEPPLMRGKDDSVAVAALKDFARRSYSLGDTPMFSDKAIAVYRDAGLANIARTLELYKNVREAANAVIDAPWDSEAKAKLLTLTKELNDEMSGNLSSATHNDFVAINSRGAAILDAASPETKAAFSPAELKNLRSALEGKKGVFNVAAKRMETFGQQESAPLAEHIADAAAKVGHLANHGTMTGEAVRSIMAGRTSFGTTVELLAHGLGPNDAPPTGIDDAHLSSSKPLGKGGVNTVSRVVYEGADGVERAFVFKAESSARQGFLSAQAAFGLYSVSQQAVMLNLATQDVADAIGAGDVTVRTFSGMCKGEYGTFMDVAQGQSPAAFKSGKEGPDGFGKASLQSLAEKVRAGDDAAVAKAKTLVSTFAQKANRLAWLDAITGQLDRHSENYFVSVDEKTGAVDLKAIDNDIGFSSHATGLMKFHMDKAHSHTFQKTLSDIRSTFYPGLSQDDFEAAHKLDAEHGVTKNPDGTISVDIAKFASPVAFIGVNSLGWNCVPVPDEIDEDMYNNLMALDKQPDGSPSQGRIDFEKQLRPRLGEAEFNAAMTRLDEAIAAAKDIAAAGRVRKPEYWSSDEAIGRAAHGAPAVKQESILPTIGGNAPDLAAPRKSDAAEGYVQVAGNWTDYMHRDMPELGELAGALLQPKEGEQ